MPTSTIAPDFMELQNKVKKILARGYQLKTIDTEHLLASLYILGQAKSKFELEMFIGIFSDAFPFLQEISEEKTEVAQEKMESAIKKILSKIVKKDPLKATEIAKAALEPGMTMEKLVQKFPELK